jgi:hypothetical protein
VNFERFEIHRLKRGKFMELWVAREGNLIQAPRNGNSPTQNNTTYTTKNNRFTQHVAFCEN